METSGWAQLPSDLLMAISKRIGDDLQVLLLVCRAWNLSMKQQIMKLQPAALGRPWSQQLNAVTHLHVPVLRSKLHGALAARMPLDTHRNGCDLASCWFPALQAVDLSGQDLSGAQQLRACLGGSTSIRSLSLAGCNIALSEVSCIVSNMRGLQHLDLSGILVEVLVGSPSTVREEQASLFQGLLLLSRLASLQLDRLETTARVPPAVYPKHAQHFAPALSLTGRLAELLPASTYGGSLTSLSIHGHHLLESDVAALGRLTGLSSLSMDWRLGPTQARGPAAPPLPALPDAAGFHLMSLTSLTSLRMVFLRQVDVGAGPSEQQQGPRGTAPFTVAPLKRLRRLGLPGCNSIGLALSAGRLGATLEELDLSCCSEAITPGLVVQICSKLPLLTALTVGNCEWAPSFELPGDILLSGLAAVCPLLRTLRMQGIKLHGTGLCPGGPSGAPGLPLLCDLVIDGGRLLRGRIGDIGELRRLQKLTLANVMPAEFLASSRSGAYLHLSALTALTALRILAPCARCEVMQRGLSNFNIEAIIQQAVEQGGEGEEGQAAWGAGHPGGGAAAGAPSAPFSSPVSSPSEPHLQFASLLPSLRVLALTAVKSSGLCLRHLSGLTQLQALHIGGSLAFTDEGLSAIRSMSLPSLQSLQLTVCAFEGQCLQDNNQAAAGRRGNSGQPSGISRLLSALAVATPSLRNLEVGDCPGLTEAELRAATTAPSFPRLRYLTMHGLALSREACCRALERIDTLGCSAVPAAAGGLRYFAAWPLSSASQAKEGAVLVPLGGMSARLNVDVGPWPLLQTVGSDAAAGSPRPDGVGAAEDGASAGRSSQSLPAGEAFFARYPHAVLDPNGARLRGRGFTLVRSGPGMVLLQAQDLREWQSFPEYLSQVD